MKISLPVTLFLFLGFTAFGQITYDKGYYIDNEDRTVPCLIKNLDWINNPTEFEYKLNEEDTPKKRGIATVKEFSIPPSFKYIRATVELDRSDDKDLHPTKDPTPRFQTETLFLKVLVEGKAHLYQYSSRGNLNRFFFSTAPQRIEPLVYSTYATAQGTLAKNNTYKEQLWAALKCHSITVSKLNALSYTKNDLLPIFTLYSTCANEKYTEYIDKKRPFSLTLKPRLSRSNLSIEHYELDRNVDFGTKMIFGLGLEAEVSLPFHRNKWSISVEPSFRSYVSSKTEDSRSISGGKLISSTTYRSLEMPVTLRHYFLLGPSSKIFVNVTAVTDIPFNSFILLKRTNGTTLAEIKLKTASFLAIGAGYKLNNRYSIEVRSQTNARLLGHDRTWQPSYSQLSLMLGYALLN